MNVLITQLLGQGGVPSTRTGSGELVQISPSADFTKVGEYTLSNILSTGITLLLIVAGIIFFVYLILGGIKWMTSGGDKASTEGARNQITAALIGLVIVFSAWAIVELIGSVFGIKILEFTIPTIV